MSVNVIFACDSNYGIGKDNMLPWPKNKEDMRWFRNNTMDGICIMGRKTWESLGNKPLSGRVNIVLSKLPVEKFVCKKTPPYGVWSGAIAGCIDHYQKEFPDKKIWIIGGANVYEQSFELCDKIFMTKFNSAYDCDVFVNPAHFLKFSVVSRHTDNDVVFYILDRNGGCDV